MNKILHDNSRWLPDSGGWVRGGGPFFSDLPGRARTGRPSVRIMQLGVVLCQVSVA